MTYWLSRAGATQAEGPFAARQLQTMWSNGQISAADQVCPTDVPESWLPAQMVIDEIDGAQAQQAERIRLREVMRAQAQLDYDRRKKSEAVALVLSLLIPFGSLFYVGRTGMALLGLAFCFAVGLAAGPLPLLVGYVLSLVLAVREVRRYNEQLARELGLS